MRELISVPSTVDGLELYEDPTVRTSHNEVYYVYNQSRGNAVIVLKDVLQLPDEWNDKQWFRFHRDNEPQWHNLFVQVCKYDMVFDSHYPKDRTLRQLTFKPDEIIAWFDGRMRVNYAERAFAYSLPASGAARLADEILTVFEKDDWGARTYTVWHMFRKYEETARTLIEKAVDDEEWRSGKTVSLEFRAVIERIVRRHLVEHLDREMTNTTIGAVESRVWEQSFVAHDGCTCNGKKPNVAKFFEPYFPTRGI